MIFPQPSQDEQRRLETLRQYALLDSLPEQALDDLTALAAQLCETPISLISLVDERRQWFKSKFGASASETPREISFCTHTIRQSDVFVVPDAANDARFAESPLVTGEMGIRFYAGAPLVTEDGAALGTLCVLDRVPRELTEAQRQAIRILSRQAMAQLDLGRQTREVAERERLLRAIFDANPECVKLLGRDGSLRMMNRVGLEIIEADSFAQVAGHCVYPLVVPEHRAAVEELTKRVFRGESASLEFQLTGLKGTTRWVESHVAPLRDAQGEVTDLLGITRDITERHCMEEARRVSELRFAKVFRSNPAAIAMNTMHTGRLIEVNDRICEFFGWKRDEVIGRTIFELGVWEDVAQRGQLILQVTETGSVRDAEVVLRGASGELRDVVMSMERVEMPGESEPVLVVMFSDLTARKRAERLVSGQKQILELVARGTSLPETLDALTHFIESQAAGMLASVLLLDADGVHLRHGAAPSLPEAYNRMVDGIAIGPHVGSCGTAAFLGEAVVVEDIATDPRWEAYREQVLAFGLRACWSTPIFDEANQVLGTFALYYPNPARPAEHHLELINLATQTAAIAIGRHRAGEALRASEERLLQSQKLEAVGRLASGVAHDFNNLLTVIQGSASFLEQPGISDKTRAECADEIVQASERAAGLTRQLLLFSRKQRMETADLDLNEVVGNMTKMLRRILGEDVSLRTDYAPNLPLIHADSRMIEQVLLNLAVNSRDALPQGGQLTISTCLKTVTAGDVLGDPDALPGHYVCLCVQDNGIGIPPAILPHIFEPFYTTKEVGKGTGLGLATVYGIVKQHRGWLSVESEPQHGTHVRIYLPAKAGARPERTSAPKEGSFPGGSETILVVEDEPSLRRLVENVLTRGGYTVRIAESGAAALEVWAEHGETIDLVLTDMVMPGGISGRELIERLRALRPDLKFIYSSGYSVELAGKGLALVDGVNFLQKPYHLQKLASTVRARLDRC